MIVFTSELLLAVLNASSFAATVLINKMNIEVCTLTKNLFQYYLLMWTALWYAAKLSVVLILGHL